MSTQIVINQINYFLSSGTFIFKDLSLAFSVNKTGFIGRNGTGKSTLLKLIVGELTPTSGNIKCAGKIAYCPQNYSKMLNQTIAEALEIKPKLDALTKITAGSADIKNFEILNEDWDIRERTKKQLINFGLDSISLERAVSSLSGGEITKLMLAKQFIANPDFIILDEPTNNLDLDTRNSLCQAIQSYQGGMLIVSHDRKLLNIMDEIIELTALGVKIYGGNYDSYLDQKNLEYQAQMRKLEDAKKNVQKVTANINTTRVHHAKQQRAGKQLRKSGSQAKIILNAMEDRSSRTQGKIAIKEERLLACANKKLATVKEQIEIIEEMNILLPKTYIPNGKMVLQITDLNFAYSNSDIPLIKNFNLTICGSKRIAIVGKNGSGKTTLINLIMDGKNNNFNNENIKLGTSRVSYLDQHASLLKEELSVLENFKKLNPGFNDTQVYTYLARFLFKNLSALKLVKNLSGGEKIRAALACILLAENPPQLLILDEPTNHLDLESIANIESSLKNYQGALIVISHDEYFIKNIGITEIINTPLINNIT